MSEEKKMSKKKGIDINKILKEEDQIDCDLSETNYADINSSNTLFNGWTFIQNDLCEENNQKTEREKWNTEEDSNFSIKDNLCYIY